MPTSRSLLVLLFLLLGGSILQAQLTRGSTMNLDPDVKVLLQLPDQRFLSAGKHSIGFGAAGVSRSLIRHDIYGRASSDFNANIAMVGLSPANVDCVAVLTNGKILFGGDFRTVGGSTRNYIARINADGTLDSAFNPNANNPVKGILPLPDGRMMVIGGFDTLGGMSRKYIARLYEGGGVDSGFNAPQPNEPIHSIAQQTDGRLVICGAFTTLGGDRQKLHCTSQY